MNDVQIVHVFQPASDALNVVVKCKAGAVIDEPTSICQLGGPFSLSEMSGRVEDERERVVWCEDKWEDVWVG